MTLYSGGRLSFGFASWTATPPSWRGSDRSAMSRGSGSSNRPRVKSLVRVRGRLSISLWKGPVAEDRSRQGCRTRPPDDGDYSTRIPASAPVGPEAGRARIEHVEEPPRRRGEEFSAPEHDTVGAAREVGVERDRGQTVLLRHADAGDDGYPEPARHVALDDLPAARLDGHPVLDLVLLEDDVDDAPGAQVPGREDEPVRRDVVEGALSRAARGWSPGVIRTVGYVKIGR